MAALLIELIVVGFFYRAAFSVGNLLLALGVFSLPLSRADSGPESHNYSINVLCV
jgi:hypothetical protein